MAFEDITKKVRPEGKLFKSLKKTLISFTGFGQYIIPIGPFDSSWMTGWV
jgi:hypothetical protein